MVIYYFHVLGIKLFVYLITFKILLFFRVNVYHKYGVVHGILMIRISSMLDRILVVFKYLIDDNCKSMKQSYHRVLKYYIYQVHHRFFLFNIFKKIHIFIQVACWLEVMIKVDFMNMYRIVNIIFMNYQLIVSIF
jgi:hypothetical protein